MRQALTTGCAALVLLTAMSTMAQAAIQIDGILNDWGVTLDSNSHLVYDSAYGAAYSTATTPIAPQEGINVLVGGQKVTYQIEDTNDNSNNYRVGPLYGGQNYDAEGLFVSVHENDLYIAVATGQRADNGSSTPDEKYFAPGDISILGSSVWGIEVGGGQGGKSSASLLSAESVVREGDGGTTYHIGSNGYAIPSTSPHSSHRAEQTAGSVWLTDGSSSATLDATHDIDWQTGIAGSGSPRPLTQLTGGSLVSASVDYAYNFGYDPDGLVEDFGQHAFIELVIRDYADVFGNNLSGATVRWAPACGNDQLYLEAEIPKGVVPEPASLVVWSLLGGLGIAVVWYRRRKHA